MLQRGIQNNAQLANTIVAVPYLVHVALVASHTLSRPFQSITLTSTISRVIKTIADKHNPAGHDDSALARTTKLHTVNHSRFPCLITHDVAKTYGWIGSCNCTVVTKPTCCKTRHHQPNLILYETV